MFSNFKSTNHFIAWSLCIANSLGFSTVQGTYGDREAIAAADELARQVGVPFDAKRAKVFSKPKAKERIWIVEQGTSRFGVFTGANRAFSFTSNPAKEPPPTQSPLSEKQAVVRANLLREKLGFGEYDLAKVHTYRASSDADSQILVSYHPRIQGIDTQGVGNALHVDFYRSSGVLRHVQAIDQWQYAPVKIVLTADQAIEKATRLVEKFEPNKASAFVKIHKQFVYAHPSFGCTVHEADRLAWRYRYAYVVTFKKVTVRVETSDGKSLGGYLTPSEG